MKQVITMLAWATMFVGWYLVLSCVGMIWVPYKQVLFTLPWAIVYAVLIGWWVAMLPCIWYWEGRTPDEFSDGENEES